MTEADAYTERKSAAVLGMRASRINPPSNGEKRQWVKCIRCGDIAYYDFVPYSLSNPIMTLPCHHDFYRETRGATEEEVIEFFAAVAEVKQ